MHRSYSAEQGRQEQNERLEFLGDAVLGFVVADHLFRENPDFNEGDLTRIRAEVVSTQVLAPIARELGIGDAVLLGRGEEQSGGRDKPSILADALEAIIGAAYLSSGVEAAAAFTLDLLTDELSEISGRPELGDPKNRLQELAARSGLPPPRYELAESGPDHARRFSAIVHVGGVAGAGAGSSKKRAEREAARAAIAALIEQQAAP